MYILQCKPSFNFTDLDKSLYKKPNSILGCISGSRMSRALEVMTLYSVSQTEFGFWVFMYSCSLSFGY